MSQPRSIRSTSSALFARWFWIVYLPLGLLIAFFILLVVGILPRQAFPGLAALALWGLLATRLLLERRRKGLEVPPPRSILIWIGSITALILVGGALFWIGADRLSSNSGIIMVGLGGFLMIFAVTAPTFKLVDFGMRKALRVLRRLLSRAAGPRKP